MLLNVNLSPFSPYSSSFKIMRKEMTALKTLILTVALAIIVVCFCVVYAIRRCFTAKPVVDKLNFPPTVKETLDKLFEGTKYAIDALPIYPLITGWQCVPEREKMTSNIMKGKSNTGQLFIAIKVNCTLSAENIQNLRNKDKYKKNPLVKDLLILFQSQPQGPVRNGENSKLVWEQVWGDTPLEPSFFTQNFTNAKDGLGPTETEIDNFKSVHTLLKTGASKDLNGLLWTIPKE